MKEWFKKYLGWVGFVAFMGCALFSALEEIIMTIVIVILIIIGGSLMMWESRNGFPPS